MERPRQVVPSISEPPTPTKRNNPRRKRDPSPGGSSPSPASHLSRGLRVICIPQQSGELGAKSTDSPPRETTNTPPLPGTAPTPRPEERSGDGGRSTRPATLTTGVLANLGSAEVRKDGEAATGSVQRPRASKPRLPRQAQPKEDPPSGNFSTSPDPRLNRGLRVTCVPQQSGESGAKSADPTPKGRPPQQSRHSPTLSDQRRRGKEGGKSEHTADSSTCPLRGSRATCVNQRSGGRGRRTAVNPSTRDKQTHATPPHTSLTGPAAERLPLSARRYLSCARMISREGGPNFLLRFNSLIK